MHETPDDGRARHRASAPRRARPPATPCALDGDLRGGDRSLARARPHPRDGRRVLVRRGGTDQRVHRRVPDPEPRARARRGHRPLRRLRTGLQRAPREGRAAPRVARRLDDLLARPPLHDGTDGDLRARRAAHRRALRRSGRRLRPRRRPLARALPDRDPARALGDRGRDPERVRPLHRAGADAGRLEPRDHRRAARMPSSTSTPARS